MKTNRLANIFEHDRKILSFDHVSDTAWKEYQYMLLNFALPQVPAFEENGITSSSQDYFTIIQAA